MVARDHAGRWLPGKSANPAGLAADIAPLVAEARRLALSHAPYAVQRLRDLLDSKDEHVVSEAAKALLDRAGLRPYSLEPERLSVEVAAVDVDEMRAQLATKIEGLIGYESHAPGELTSGSSSARALPEASVSMASPRQPPEDAP